MTHAQLRTSVSQWLVFATTHPAQKVLHGVGHHGTRTVAWLRRGKILLTYASLRGEEKEFPDRGETFKSPS